MRKAAILDVAARAEAIDEKAAQLEDEVFRAATRRLVFLMHGEPVPHTAEWYAQKTGLDLKLVLRCLEALENEGAVQSAGGGPEESETA